MGERFLNGVVTGAGFVAVLAVAFLVAWAGDVFTIDKDGTLKFAVNDQGKITVGATESYVNLVIQNNAGASTDKVDITADVLTVEGVRLEGLNVSADVTAAVGAGGRDTNFADAANTWYYVWVITNNDGTLANGILTLAPATPNPPTPPVLPSGFTKKRRVGAVRNDGASAFLQFVQEGSQCAYLDGATGTGNALYADQGATASWTVKSAAVYIPPTSRRGISRISFGARNTSNGVFRHRLRKAGSTGANGQSVVSAFSPAGVMGYNEMTAGTDTDSSQQIEYTIAAADTYTAASAQVVGYYDRI